MRRAYLAVVAASLLFAGCMGPSGSEEAAEPVELEGVQTSNALGEDEEAQDEFTTSKQKGQTIADAANLGLPTGTYRGATVLVPKSAQSLVAEIKWTGDASSFDLVIQSPRFCPADSADPESIATSFACGMAFYVTGESPGTFRMATDATDVGPGYLKLVLDADVISQEPCDDRSCEWTAIPWWRVAVEAEYEAALTVFYKTAPPADFTAFDA